MSEEDSVKEKADAVDVGVLEVGTGTVEETGGAVVAGMDEEVG